MAGRALREEPECMIGLATTQVIWDTTWYSEFERFQLDLELPWSMCSSFRIGSCVYKFAKYVSAKAASPAYEQTNRVVLGLLWSLPQDALNSNALMGKRASGSSDLVVVGLFSRLLQHTLSWTALPDKTSRSLGQAFGRHRRRDAFYQWLPALLWTRCWCERLFCCGTKRIKSVKRWDVKYLRWYMKSESENFSPT